MEVRHASVRIQMERGVSQEVHGREKDVYSVYVLSLSMYVRVCACASCSKEGILEIKFSSNQMMVGWAVLKAPHDNICPINFQS